MVQLKHLKDDNKKGGKTQLFKQGKQKPHQQQFVQEKKPQQQLLQQKKPLQQLAQQKKPQLQFASSDEDSDEDEVDSVLDEEEIDDEELEGEELEDEDLDDEELEDEEELYNEDEEEEEDEAEDEGPLTKTPVKGLVKDTNASAKKNAVTPLPTPAKNGTSDKKSILKGVNEESAKSKKKNVDLSSVASPTPVSKTPATPHPPLSKMTKAQLKESRTPQSAAKVTPMEVDTPQTKDKKNKTNTVETPAPTSAKKRKATDEEASAKSAPPQKLSRPNDIINEEERRREERNKRSLFLKNVGKLLRKSNELKALHPDVVSVRSFGPHAWLLFPSEVVCDKAFKQLQATKVKGKSLEIDFCGTKALNPEEAKRKSDLEARPIDKKTLLLNGVPVDMSAEKLKILFPTSTYIDVPKQNKKNPKHTLNVMAFVHFANEQDAHTVFKKGDSLKIGGVPVEVLYAREKHPREGAKIEPKTQEQQLSKKQQQQTPKDQPKQKEVVSAKKAAEQQQKLKQQPPQQLLKGKLQQKATPTPAAKLNGKAKQVIAQESDDDDDVDSSSGDDDDIPSSEEGIEETDSDDE